jgi:hypothetical protein
MTFGEVFDMVYSGHIKNGVVVFDQPVVLPEGLEVSIEVSGKVLTQPVDEEQISSPTEPLLKYAGKAVGLPEDSSLNHDHYLYGTPKR